MLIAGPEDNLGAIEASQPELNALTGLTIFMRRPSERQYQEPMLPCRLTASSLDHPGIVHRLTSELSQGGINIESMETKTYLAPWSGTPIFRMEAIISIPAELNVSAIRTRFDEIEREENIDIGLNLLSSQTSNP